MAAPSIEPIERCLYGRHIGSARRHTFQPVSRALAGASASTRIQKERALSRGISGTNCVRLTLVRLILAANQTIINNGILHSVTNSTRSTHNT